ncbi:MAG: NAD(P)H-hydrate epimerase, partial [Jannaschia sp.]
MTLLTASQMRAVETAAFESGAVTGLDLMERAGRGAVEAIEAEWPGLAATSGRALVLCGPGNNGGDGFVVARLLAHRGWAVEAFLYGDAAKLPADARLNHERFLRHGVVRPVTDLRHVTSTVDLFIDAVFGIGLSRPLPPEVERALDIGCQLASGRAGGRVVALDVPSGLCADSGRFLGKTERAAREADLTIAFGSAKVGHFLADGPAASGRLRIVDLGLGARRPGRNLAGLVPEVGKALGWDVAPARLTEMPRASVQKGSMGPERHKYDHGHVLVLAGGLGRTGAARLAARGALRIGAGLVSVGAPGAALLE